MVKRIVIVDTNRLLSATLSLIAKKHYKINEVIVLPDGVATTATEIAEFLESLSSECRVIVNADSEFNHDSRTEEPMQLLLPFYSNHGLSIPLILSFSRWDQIRERSDLNRVLFRNDAFYHFVQLPAPLESMKILFK